MCVNNKRILKGIWYAILLFVSLYSVYCIAMAQQGKEIIKKNGWSRSSVPYIEETTKRSSDVFTILEIVPFKGMGEIGYLVGGSEPIDIHKLTSRKYDGLLRHLGDMLRIEDTYKEKRILTDEEKKQTGTWKKVYIADAKRGTFIKTGARNGEYELTEGVSYVYNGKQSGRYQARLKKLTFDDEIDGIRVKNKNVNAYFYPVGQPMQQTPFCTTYYTVANAKLNANHAGNYEYDRENNYYILNKNKGAYDVLFRPYEGKRGQQKYYMGSEYEIVSDCKGEYTGEIAYVSATDIDNDGRPDGEYDQVKGNCYTFVGTNNGAYRFVEQDADQEGNVNPVRTIYEPFYYSEGVKYTNAEWFKKRVLKLSGSDIDQYKVVVKTVTPADINKDKSLIDQAGIIYMTPTVKNNADVGLWELFARSRSDTHNKEGRYTKARIDELGDIVDVAVLSRKLPNFSENDLDWEATMKIFKRVGVEKSIPIILNRSIYEDGIQELASDSFACNNCFKLYLMLNQWEPEVFHNYFISERNSIKSSNYFGKTTGVYKDEKGKEWMIWDKKTFLPSLPEGELTPMSYYDRIGMKDYDLRIEEGVFQNIYLYRDNRIIDKDFIVKMDGYDENRYQEAQDYMDEILYGDAMVDEEGNHAVLTPSDVVHYLLRYKKVVLNKGVLRVLDLEPCAEYSLTEDTVRDFMKGYDGRIQIIRMTTAEFNGKIEDVNKEYDMIYMGLNIGKLNTVLMKDKKRRTVYNDTALNGYVYLHVGDYVVGGSALKGLVNDTTRYRYSGNDITTIKKEQLTEYVKAGYPIVMEEDLYTAKGSVIDPYSQIYALSVECHTYKNVINASELIKNGEEEFGNYKVYKDYMKALSLEKPRIKLIRVPKQYIAPLSDQAVEFESSSDTLEERTMEFMFEIQDAEAKENKKITYTVEVYIDMNADGRFLSNERVIEKPLCNVGEEILIRKILPKSFEGIVPWKLLVYRTDKEYVRSNCTGNFEVLRSAKNKKQLKILQITSSSIPNISWTGSTVNLQEELNNKDSLFYKYTPRIQQDVRTGYRTSKPTFMYDIKTIEVDEFVAQYTHHPYDRSNKKEDFLSEYDMLIFGFGDSYKDITNDHGALDNVFDFIEEGKSVLFSHDTTSLCNQKSKELYYTEGIANWGYHINKYLRNRIGMDRYGVTIPKGMRDKKDKAYAPDGTRYKEIQGYTYATLKQYNMVEGDYVRKDTLFPGHRQYGPFQSITMNGSYMDSYPDFNSYTTNLVTKMNEGQITQYPYKIDDTIEVATTHGQYYELDLEDKELVVWYCLGNTNGDELYSSSPNDARNNYYIYNKGNITYTGAGHSNFATSKEEVKLFINTMVAAYRASLLTQKIIVTNGRESDKGESFFYEDCEYSMTKKSATAADMVKVCFVVEDQSIIPRDAVIKVYDEASVEVPITVYDEKNARVSDNKVKTGDGQEGKQRDEYYFFFPKKYLDGKESTYFTIVADNGKAKAKKNVHLLRRNLFNLK